MPETWTGTLIGKMHNKGITYDDLAKEMGVSKPYISMILNGSRKPEGIRKRMEDAVASIIGKKKEDGQA
jgi:transcriptional regulator with XRE-family HTH domain